MKILYRVEDSSIHMIIDTPLLHNLFQTYKFEVVRETSKSYVIIYNNKEKFVRKNGKNIFAFDTETKALFNYFKRKEKQVKILENKLERAKIAKSEVKKVLKEKRNDLPNSRSTLLS